jgi:hypothetical protein
VTGQQFLGLSNSLIVELTGYTYACRGICGMGQVVRSVIYPLISFGDGRVRNDSRMLNERPEDAREGYDKKAQIEDDPKKLSREGKPVVGIRMVSSDKRINLKDGLNKRKW